MSRLTNLFTVLSLTGAAVSAHQVAKAVLIDQKLADRIASSQTPDRKVFLTAYTVQRDHNQDNLTASALVTVAGLGLAALLLSRKSAPKAD